MMQKNLEISALFDIYSGLLSEKQQNALEYYYNDDLSLSEISELVGISRQGVRDQLKHAEFYLEQLEGVLHLYEKSQKTEKILSELKGLAKESNNERIMKLVDEIEKVND